MNRKRVRLAAEGSVAQNGKLVAAFRDKLAVKASRPSSAGVAQAIEGVRHTFDGLVQDAEGVAGVQDAIDGLASDIKALRQLVEEYEQNQALLIAKGATQQQIDERLDVGRRGLAYLRENYVEMLEIEGSMLSTWKAVLRVCEASSSINRAVAAGIRFRKRSTDPLRRIDRRSGGLAERGPPAPAIVSQPNISNAPPALCRVGCFRPLGAHIAA